MIKYIMQLEISFVGTGFHLGAIWRISHRK